MMRNGERGGKLTSTIAKELLVAASGIVLVLFILGHLAGNFFIYGGPEAYNAYSRHLHALGPLLSMVRFGLTLSFFVHAGFTVWLALADRAARGTPYAMRRYRGGTNLAKLTMVYTGMIVFVFVFLHLRDFTFGDLKGPGTVVAGMNNGQSLALYGLVWNSFANPVHSALYMVAMAAVGLHFSNAVSTIWVTLGVLTDAATAKANLVARVLGAGIAVGFSSIPIYVLAHTFMAR